MSLVCFPFKVEKVDVVLRNVKIAAQHERVCSVLLVGHSVNQTYKDIEAGIEQLRRNNELGSVAVEMITQKRLGTKRAGKGDGMNTALLYFLHAHEADNEFGPALASQPLERLHFYDADIESFDSTWITKSEDAADMDYEVIRCYFPRSSTDAQITWQITKVGFSLLWPLSVLPWVQQPLGGELCFTRRAVELLVSDPRVMAQSDWGIDTMYTFCCAQNGLSMIEVYLPQGKLHALYGGLRDLFNMLTECFAAVQSLKMTPIRADSLHRIAPAELVPYSVTSKIGYDVESTLGLLRERWTPRQEQLLHKYFDQKLVEGLLKAREWPVYAFMDEEAWLQAYEVFLEHFNMEDNDWKELLFKAWVARVLNYTMRHVIRGYDTAMLQLRTMVSDVQRESAKKLIAQRRGEEQQRIREESEDSDEVATNATTGKPRALRRVPSDNMSLFSDSTGLSL
uniref:Uncharacterized protein n=1 Tax=Timspurckia oligopyrenoides TaxID=708627 RepID=A0A7S0ZC90_9RHOD|mmetsp:Transcript_12069/g.21827  ORF Transcript_12069/g.21827 Transcript_12069/m.21827 type:complete len:453 (+) Transcript_12069:184-1542(+)|eukprot:CAMPEP_0182448548 /NCGR_PEP_ID=MMETSP1172-20130603/28009_1 /TAXON_ID=708627 /ORGANISM="Timspurckia oligopyrenoides, Strain CCMP3278" /LENGTH=452 /DNA_ID=CAMNT_0024645459 /DNA_START=128 /DNA_END=1486 /DNA_ORIENTATION=+